MDWVLIFLTSLVNHSEHQILYALGGKTANIKCCLPLASLSTLHVCNSHNYMK